MFTRADVMFGLDPSLTTRAAGTGMGGWLWQALLLYVGSAVYFSVCAFKGAEFKGSASVRVFVCVWVSLSFVCLCCFQRRRHALSDAAVVATQHRNVGGRISCP